MKVSEILNEQPYWNDPRYAVKLLQDWWKRQPTAQRLKDKKLARQTLNRWARHLERLETAGNDIDDRNVLKQQFDLWANRFFNVDYVDSNGFTLGDPQKAKNYITQIVYRKLAGVNLNTGMPNNTTQNMQQPAQPQATTQQPGAQPAQQNTNQSNTPVGGVVITNLGKYTKTANGWVNEYNQPVKQSSHQWLDDKYNEQQRATTTGQTTGKP
jgi:hypothetical protein